jgi:flagellar motility protein MotE (MotC chaperone)
MMGYLRDLRLLPIAVVASACLLALTAADLLLDRADSAARDSEAVADASIVRAAPGRLSDAKQSWAQQMFNFPDANGSAPTPPRKTAQLPKLPQIVGDKNNGDIITGSVGGSEEKSETKPKEDPAAAKDVKDAKDAKAATPAAAASKEATSKDAASKEIPAAPKDGTVVSMGLAPAPSPAERALLERLQERRQELDKRARELDIREGLIAEAEKRIDARLTEIKEAKAQLATAELQKDQAEAARFKGLVTMYETMKPRDAAKIFDRLEVNVLLEVASLINPRNMSEILAQMSPDSAQKLTVELASHAKAVTKDPNSDLPKIEGRPTSQ